MAQQTVSAAEDKETSLTERRMLLAETLEQQKRCEQLTQQEADLRGQLSLYSDKFEEFQKTLTKSNQVFGTFKKEMDKVSSNVYGQKYWWELNLVVGSQIALILQKKLNLVLRYMYCIYVSKKCLI